ncbi:hypothetical protein LWI29_031177 [Acer saccharum]|uniref:Uncharacterized protein n=1 Tax=Acer saccharum TaxID=4024 RepID=A0AA39VWF9_ACESA|nr:hypothetical protein LWI29_031177 [Acer saccharum]
MAIFGLTSSNALPESKFDLVSVIGLILVAVGRAGLIPFVRAFTTKQLESHEPDKQNIMEERVNAREKTWWRFAWVSSSLYAAQLFSYSWTQCFIHSGSMMGIAFVLFMWSSHPSYHKTKSDIAEKPFTCIRVFWAALLKRHMEYPSSPAHFFRYNINDGDDGLELWPRAKLLGWLDKAAIIEFESTLGQDKQEKAGRLCTVTEVQQTKYILKMVPMWSSFPVFGLVLSAGNTFFAEQADDLKSQDLLIYLVLLQSIASELVSTVPPFLLSKWFPHVTKLNRIMMRIFGGMLMSMLCSAVACLVEGHRLDIVANNRASRHIYQIIPMSIWWLAPQFFLLGVMDGLATGWTRTFYN